MKFLPLTRFLFLVLTIVVVPAAHAATAPRPNIVFICADDWGWGNLSSHGHPWLQTLHPDRLAREGTDFHQFNVLNPVCSRKGASQWVAAAEFVVPTLYQRLLILDCHGES